MKGMRFFAVALGGWLYLGAAAPAATTADVLTQWGLIGTWADDCSQPALKGANVHMTYAIEGNQVVRHDDYGGWANSHTVVGATLGSDGTLTWQLYYPEGIGTFELTGIKNRDGQYRVLQAHNIDTGQFTIRDGVFVVSGKPAPWLNHCS